jgi:hypothetical protein
MRTFQEFVSLCEATYDKDVMSSSQIRQTGEGGRIRPERKKSTPERRRVKAVGGGKTEPVEYKPRKDIGTQRKTETRVQQPEKERGSKEVAQSYAEKVKAERKKAAQARAANKGGKAPEAAKPKAKEVAKTASKLLSKKKEVAKPAAGYTAPKASGLTAKERMSITRKGETKLRGIMTQQETEKYKKETGQNPTGKAKTKVLAMVHKRMST